MSPIPQLQPAELTRASLGGTVPAMDDTPRHFLEEFRVSIFKKRVGQIALAIVLAEAVWRLIRGLTWYLIMPVIARILNGNTESVLLKNYGTNPIQWDTLGGYLLEFVFTVIVVFYLNRWIHRKPQAAENSPEEDAALVGERAVPSLLTPTE